MTMYSFFLFVRRRSFRVTGLVLFIMLVNIFLLACVPPAAAQARAQGQWQTLPNLMPINPVNAATLQYDPFHGQLRSTVYDPSNGQFTDVQNMAHGRWYPTVTNLSSGSLMTFSGLDENGNTNSTVEIYTVGSGWSATYASPFTPPLYPRMHLLPSGDIFYSGSTTSSRYFDPSAHMWSSVVATTNYSGTRTYGTSVLLPLNPADNYRPRVMIMGGNNPATATTELI